MVSFYGDQIRFQPAINGHSKVFRLFDSPVLIQAVKKHPPSLHLVYVFDLLNHSTNVLGDTSLRNGGYW